ncbi:hypothetical protein Halha_2437 [Halobacteroides halobius DSM 5150]|uniref:L,D-TPase catalytic domain-containing protein n=1 Tax=Halobacteroides halobius (strain ATCC 35273 / DSM 5150 / MD-1) TaxID=748449 RepID=L0KBE4_HALHC|nr:L,D-transpeptidase [Halobacteroides halobius]AGB42311.1 hypothetical protein Halha_2437 [Halobacteroides halobius DSM 5150]
MDTKFPQNNLLKRLLFLLLLILLILLGLLFNNSLSNNSPLPLEKKTAINYQKLKQQIDDYLTKQKKAQPVTITSNQALNKLRTALYLYLQDHYQLPKNLKQLLGTYLKNIPPEPISDDNKVSFKLDYTGGWYYNPQLTGPSLAKLITTSLRPNTKQNNITDFRPYHILVNTTKDKLYLKQGSKIIKEYPIADGGKLSPTPKGRFRIEDKAILNKQQREKYGKYWLELDLWTKGGGYGIHATTNQRLALTNQTSQGCIRLKPKDIAELYQLVPTKVTVFIK